MTERAVAIIRRVTVAIVRCYVRTKTPLVLVSEDHGRIHGNNGYEFWLSAQQQGLFRVVLVVNRRRTSKRYLKELRSHPSKTHVRRNSLRHWILYHESDLHAVCYSYRDVHPDRFLGRSAYMRAKKPVFHLRHGYEAIKVTRARGRSFGNNLVRYCVPTADTELVTELQEMRGFHTRQTLQVIGLLRWRTLFLQANRRAPGDGVNAEDSVIWFVTWREADGGLRSSLDEYAVDLISDIREAIAQTAGKGTRQPRITIILHDYWPDGSKARLENALASLHTSRIEIRMASEVDIRDCVLEATALVTDYSSLAFEFAALGKPVYFHCPDIDEYSKRRQLYNAFEEAMMARDQSADSLAKWLVDDERKSDSFLQQFRFSNNDREAIISGDLHKAIVNEVHQLLDQRLLFVGYNFFGIGGTVTSTRNAASALSRAGYLVELIALRETSAKVSTRPPAVTVRGLHRTGRWRVSRIQRSLDWLLPARWLLPNDRNHPLIATYALLRLMVLLRARRYRLIVSTRESLHPLLHDLLEDESDAVYWFHTSVDSLDANFPGLLHVLDGKKLPMVAAPTPGYFERLEERFDFRGYERASYIPNTLDARDIISRHEIRPVSYINRRLICLLRLTPDRAEDISQIFDFARHLRTVDSPYRLHVYGKGELFRDVRQQLIDENLGSFLSFKGATPYPIRKIRAARCVLDFSFNHSFGMIYIESLLNGTPVFARRNPGSERILGGADWFFEDNSDLLAKIDGAPFIGLNRLVSLYDSAYARYGPPAVVERFVKEFGLCDTPPCPHKRVVSG